MNWSAKYRGWFLTTCDELEPPEQFFIDGKFGKISRVRIDDWGDPNFVPTIAFSIHGLVPVDEQEMEVA